MSTNHTPGRLRFDPERAEHGCCWDAGIVDEEGLLTAEAMTEDARRLVACWNACEGLDTQFIENLAEKRLANRFIEWSDMVRQRDELQAEVSRLRAALEDIATHADPYGLRAKKALAPQEGGQG